ncbi:DUF5799 family protein [Halohasta litorea]|uniref:DUF5799 family protein n=1 Tax=Halohasta litorea TaxID=869891 RepID=A0ABD6D7K1_9EURY|nr:DUF5799 family protein [Halohasta litorea]
MSHWTDAIIGERMAVDGSFSDRVTASQFSTAEWDLIMTATDLEMVEAEDPEAARIVANTDDVAAIIPELESIRAQTAAMGGGPTSEEQTPSGGGIVGSIKRALGLGSDGDDGDGVDGEKLAAAEELTAEYAEALQTHLEEADRFEQARQAYLDR